MSHQTCHHPGAFAVQYHSIVVPIANPDTAPALLNLAYQLVGEDGRVIGLYVTNGEGEDYAEKLDVLEGIVEEASDEARPIVFKKYVGTSVIRGIMDTVREENGDLLILGVQQKKSGEFQLGAISENVTRAAVCDVVIYRAARKGDAGANAEGEYQRGAYHRVVVPVDGSPSARAACEVGILLADETPIEAMYAQERGEPRWHGTAQIAHALEDIEGAERFKRSVITADQPAAGILARLKSSDLTVLGIKDRSQLERWLYGDFSREILNRATGAVLLVYREATTPGVGRAVQRGLNRLRLNLTEVEQEELEWQGDRMGAPSLDFFVLTLIAATLASLGLLLNSSAVIIGAMLVAPLMQPLIALAVGMSAWNVRLFWRGIFTLARGIVAALAVSVLVAALVPTSVLTPEILARTNPSLPDLAVAFVSGVVGAYATVRKDIPAALAGVAIAAALMPPLCVVGINIAAGNLAVAERAALLFLTNITAITVAAWLCFAWAGLRPRLEHKPTLAQRLLQMGTVVAAVAIIGAMAYLVVSTNNRPLIEDRLRAALNPAEVVSLEMIPDNPIRLVVVVRAAQPPTREQVVIAEAALNEALSVPVQLEVVALTTIALTE